MRISNLHNDRKSGAFSLIELLVVVAICAILAALLFPVFARAHESRGSACLTNNQQFTEAYVMYTQDYDQTVSLESGALRPYIRTQAVASCPLVVAGERRYCMTREADAQAHGNGNGNGNDNGNDNGNGEAGDKGARHSSPNMTYHGGKIMKTAVTKNIFWGPSWATYTGDEITGLDTWYTGFSSSNYAKTSDEYTGSNGTVGPITTHMGHLIDTTTAASGGNTTAILAEVCKEITSPDPSGNGYYAVYTDLPRGSAGYCAYHSAGSCGGVPVQFAFFWKLDGDSGCDPQDSTTGHSQGLAALANVSGHELSEARTDPASPGAWYDGSGEENGDKCAWTFNVPSVAFPNGTFWKIQGEWSNKAYTASTGYPNSSGQKGCLDGH